MRLTARLGLSASTVRAIPFLDYRNLLGYVGYNVKYNKASVVNVTCKTITSDNSTFIEISTNETLEDFCEKETCKPINETNLIITSNCTVIGGAAPVNCSANATCKEGNFTINYNKTSSVQEPSRCTLMERRPSILQSIVARRATRMPPGLSSPLASRFPQNRVLLSVNIRKSPILR